MSNIVDELVVVVKVDGKATKKGLSETVADVEAAKKRINVSAEDQQRIENSRAQRTREREQRQEKERKGRDRERAKSTQELGDKVQDVAFAIGGAVLGFESLKGAVSFLGNLNNATAALGRSSANLGQTTAGLQGWGNAVSLAGGDAKEAQTSFAALSQQMTAFKLRGEVGPLLALAQQNGVYTRDAQGNTKPLDQLLPQIVDAVRSRYSRADAFNLLSSAGVSESLFNLLADPNREKYLAAGRSTAFADDAMAQRAAGRQARFTNYRQVVAGDLAVGTDKVLTDPLGAINTVTNKVARFGSDAVDLFASLFGERGADPGIRRNNPGNIEAKDGSFRQYTTMAEGVAAVKADVDYKIDRDGLNSVRQIISKYAPPTKNGKFENNTEAYINDVAQRLDVDPDDPIGSPEQRRKLVEAIINHEHTKAGVAQISRAVSTPGAAGDTNNTGGDTTLHVGTIQVNGVDPNNTRNVAGGIFNAMGSKLASQANQGVTP
jgi:hypothetical protein